MAFKLTAVHALLELQANVDASFAHLAGGTRNLWFWQVCSLRPLLASSAFDLFICLRRAVLRHRGQSAAAMKVCCRRALAPCSLSFCGYPAEPTPDCATSSIATAYARVCPPCCLVAFFHHMRTRRVGGERSPFGSCASSQAAPE